MKLVFCFWLVLPIFNGAAYIYENFVRRYVKVGSFVSSSYPEEQRRVLQMMSLDARKSVERYIERYGSEAFDRVIRAVCNASQCLITFNFLVFSLVTSFKFLPHFLLESLIKFVILFLFLTAG